MNYKPNFVKTTDIKCRCCAKKGNNTTLFKNIDADGRVEIKCHWCKSIITIKLEGNNAKR